MFQSVDATVIGIIFNYNSYYIFTELSVAKCITISNESFCLEAQATLGWKRHLIHDMYLPVFPDHILHVIGDCTETREKNVQIQFYRASSEKSVTVRTLFSSFQIYLCGYS